MAGTALLPRATAQMIVESVGSQEPNNETGEKRFIALLYFQIAGLFSRKHGCAFIADICHVKEKTLLMQNEQKLIVGMMTTIHLN